MATSNGIAPPGPLTNVSGWENFKEEMDMYFVVVKEEDEKTKLITWLYMGKPKQLNALRRKEKRDRGPLKVL